MAAARVRQGLLDQKCHVLTSSNSVSLTNTNDIHCGRVIVPFPFRLERVDVVSTHASQTPTAFEVTATAPGVAAAVATEASGNLTTLVATSVAPNSAGRNGYPGGTYLSGRIDCGGSVTALIDITYTIQPIQGV